MGNVGLNALVYLLAKLDMQLFAELESGDLFDIDDVEVRAGLIQIPRRPRNRLFLWKDPAGRHDLLLLLGEAQPPVGKYAFCREVITRAKEYGVERVLTFAAMATSIHPRQPSRVFGAATGAEGVRDLRRLEVELLEEGHVGGLNGVLLGAALEAGIEGVCLLGELPQVLLRLVYPKASRAILEAFTTMTGIDLDFRELASQVAELDRRLQRVMEEMESPEESEEFEEGVEDGAGHPPVASPPAKERLTDAEKAQIEDLFTQAGGDRTRAFELKQLLDRLGVFPTYEDRFLDLFRAREP
jgi:proteasome assembly chaperone (PAC2) family protein